mgnify:CR=1 FL=1
MSDLQYILPAFGQVFTITNLALIFGGLLLGMIVGCIPGLSVTLGIICCFLLLTHFHRRIPPSLLFWLCMSAVCTAVPSVRSH